MKDMHKFSHDIQDLTNFVTSRHQVMDNLLASNTKLKARKQEIRSKLEGRIKDLAEIKSGLETDILNLQTENEELRSSLAEKPVPILISEDDFLSMKHNLNKAMEENSALKLQLGNSNKELLLIRSERDELINQLTELLSKPEVKQIEEVLVETPNEALLQDDHHSTGSSKSDYKRKLATLEEELCNER